MYRHRIAKPLLKAYEVQEGEDEDALPGEKAVEAM
jgi:hypothetical protein